MRNINLHAPEKCMGYESHYEIYIHCTCIYTCVCVCVCVCVCNSYNTHKVGYDLITQHARAVGVTAECLYRYSPTGYVIIFLYHLFRWLLRNIECC